MMDDKSDGKVFFSECCGGIAGINPVWAWRKQGKKQQVAPVCSDLFSQWPNTLRRKEIT
jgi:hypothetical protein